MNNLDYVSIKHQVGRSVKTEFSLPFDFIFLSGKIIKESQSFYRKPKDVLNKKRKTFTLLFSYKIKKIEKIKLPVYSNAISLVRQPQKES